MCWHAAGGSTPAEKARVEACAVMFDDTPAEMSGEARAVFRYHKPTLKKGRNCYMLQALYLSD